MLLVLSVSVEMNPVRFRITSPWKGCFGKGEMERWQRDRLLWLLQAPTVYCKDTLAEGRLSLTEILHFQNLREL